MLDATAPSRWIAWLVPDAHQKRGVRLRVFSHGGSPHTRRSNWKCHICKFLTVIFVVSFALALLLLCVVATSVARTLAKVCEQVWSYVSLPCNHCSAPTLFVTFARVEPINLGCLHQETPAGIGKGDSFPEVSGCPVVAGFGCCGNQLFPSITALSPFGCVPSGSSLSISGS